MDSEIDVDDTRTRVLEAARRCLESNGYQRVSIEAIANEAEVARAMVYRHFATRDDVLAGVVIRETRRVLSGIVPRAKAQPDVGAAIVKFVSLTVETGPREPTIAALVSRDN